MMSCSISGTSRGEKLPDTGKRTVPYCCISCLSVMDRGGRCKERQRDSSLCRSCVSIQSDPKPMDGRQWGQKPSPSSQNSYPEGRVDQDPSGLAECESRVMEEHQTFRETTNGQHTVDSGAGEV